MSYFLLEMQNKTNTNIYTFLALLQTLHTYFTLQYKKNMLTDGLFKEKNVWGKHISQCNSFLGGHILYEDVRAEG